MAKTKNKRPGKPRGMSYADMLARKRMIREAVQEAADDATVQLRADMATQKHSGWRSARWPMPTVSDRSA